MTAIAGQPYRAVEYDYTPDGSYGFTAYNRFGGPVVSATDNGDDTHTIQSFSNGQQLPSMYDDMMTGGGYRQSFIFFPHFGHDEVMNFDVAGFGHDTIDLSNMHSTLAQVLQHTTMVDGSATIHFGGGNTITLDGINKVELKAHPKDFVLA